MEQTLSIIKPDGVSKNLVGTILKKFEDAGFKITNIKYLKKKIENLKKDAIKQTAMEDKFNQDIEELSQETENLVSEIEKWQT